MADLNSDLLEFGVDEYAKSKVKKEVKEEAPKKEKK